jgi:2-polyprenyl-3-methyl-5-hydroxy-6-metoxy-1,4-benzoquinol methylase
MDRTQSEQDRIDGVAAEFRTEAGFNGVLIRYGFDALAPYLKAGTCLEMGAADGVMTGLLADAVERLVVVEGAGSYVDELRGRFADRQDVRIDHSLFEEYQPHERFDSIVATHVLEHVDDPVDVLARARTWVEDDGVLLAIVPNAHSFNRLLGVEMGMLEDPHELHDGDLAIGHRRVYDPDQLVSDCARAGWRVTDLSGVMFKPVSNAQMFEWFTPDMVAGCARLGRKHPAHAGDILVACSPA